MTKKIKNLTLKEMEIICDKYDECTNCPLAYRPMLCYKLYKFHKKALKESNYNEEKEIDL